MKIVLIGFMASGKSTVAAIVAKQLGYRLIEIDSEIVAQSGYSSVSEIFENKGEAFFRDLESKIAASHRDATQVVISAGGGTPMRPENMIAFKAGASRVCYLDVEFEEIENRIGDINKRPLFKDGRSARELYNTRRPVYLSHADFVIPGNDAAELVAQRVLEAVKQQCLVIGDPVAHSLSPRMHNAGYRELSIDNQFHFDRKQVAIGELPAFLNEFRKAPYRGAACTMPLKEALIPLVDSIDPMAKEIGAINTLVSENNLVKGYNTDWLGIIRPLESFGNVTGKKCLVLGAGGAARAAIVGLRHAGASVTISNRSADKAQQLANAFSISAIAWDKRLSESGWDIIINTTSLGMHPQEALSPLEGYSFHSDQIVFETVYFPTETVLLRDAKRAGARTIAGREMLLNQGAAQFELFTGHTAPVDAMRKALMSDT